MMVLDVLLLWGLDKSVIPFPKSDRFGSFPGLVLLILLLHMAPVYSDKSSD